MNERRLKRMLVATAPPDEIGAQRRAWGIARTAFAEREPMLATDENEMRWTAAGAATNPTQLEWSADATRLLVARRLPGGRFALVLFDADGRRLQTLAFDGQVIDAAFAPADHGVAVVRRVGPFSELLVVAADRSGGSRSSSEAVGGSATSPGHRTGAGCYSDGQAPTSGSSSARPM
jgi:hypothetical protein